MSSPIYIIDTSCLTQAHRVYYPFDIAPSFWSFMEKNFKSGTFIYINKVGFEIDKGNDALTSWTKTQLPVSIELDCHTDQNIMSHYGNIMKWGNNHSQYSPLAKQEFSDFNNADPFVAAVALEKLAVVVSQEISAPLAKKTIKLPDVCSQFMVSHIDTFALLRTFGFTM